ncbi:hypothetical protein A0J61_00096 [Choanephora cucurbitarum]|uniref:C2H2-type domain-containing protein n=1 Tax=Choanephora cucurbitarum TaxID=101091 RepID=A0A1C7NRZ3_9FUNG|nr:hypothetical protein A0J61_00096 [Choanephora cucurbitarum]
MNNTITSVPEIPSNHLYYNSPNYPSSSIYLSQPSSEIVSANALPPLSDLLPTSSSIKQEDYMVPSQYNKHQERMIHGYYMPPSNYSQNLPSPPTSVDSMIHSNQKVFSFISLPGMNQKKRPRRKFHEVERLYQCNYPQCTKAYGTLNHLNAHVSMQRHGPKRQPSEFKELRKLWRKQKKDNKQAKTYHEPSQSPDDLLHSTHYISPTSSHLMPSQDTFHSPLWMNHRPAYPSSQFMPLGY